MRLSLTDFLPVQSSRLSFRSATSNRIPDDIMAHRYVYSDIAKAGYESPVAKYLTGKKLSIRKTISFIITKLMKSK